MDFLTKGKQAFKKVLCCADVQSVWMAMHQKLIGLFVMHLLSDLSGQNITLKTIKTMSNIC